MRFSLLFLSKVEKMGAPWSGGLIRHVISLTAPRVEGSNPGRSASTSFIRSFNATTR